LNNNIGEFGSGFTAVGKSEITLIDVIANDNSYEGMNTFDGNLVNVINSIACGNLVTDIRDVPIAQATTCDVSVPDDIDGLRVC
jgi:hypothetical protein